MSWETTFLALDCVVGAVGLWALGWTPSVRGAGGTSRLPSVAGSGDCGAATGPGRWPWLMDGWRHAWVYPVRRRPGRHAERRGGRHRIGVAPGRALGSP